MPSPRLPPGTRNLLLVLAGAFVGYVVLERALAVPVTSWVAIAPTLSIGWSWQWATHWIASDGGGGAFRKLIELVFVYLMGSYYERVAGERRLYGLFVVGILGSGLFAMATIWLTPRAPWGDAGTTSALLSALAVRAGGRPLEVPVLGPTNAWAFVAVFGVVALVDSVYDQYVPVFASYVGASLGGYLFERWSGGAPSAGPTQRRPRRARGLRVIEGGGGDEPPRYLNRDLAPSGAATRPTTV